LTPGAFGPDGISRRVRASAERGRVQGPGRAEADFGPQTVTATGNYYGNLGYPLATGLSNFFTTTVLRGWVHRSLHDPYHDGYTANRVPVGASHSPFALVRTLRYVGVRLADPEPVDGPPSSAHDERNS
jgi:hypothetical protein